MEVFLVPVGWYRVNGHPSDPLKTWAGAEGIPPVPNLFREMEGEEGAGGEKKYREPEPESNRDPCLEKKKKNKQEK